MNEPSKFPQTQRRFAAILKVKHLLALAAFLLIVVAGTARAATLTASDYRYLLDQFGFAADNDTIVGLTADEQTRLHDLLNDRFAREYPFTQKYDAADLLFSAHMRQCSAWALAHSYGGPECPPTADASVEPGKEVADRRCNACHFVGTTTAPSFHTLAVQGKYDEQKLADALQHGHEMSPIGLAPEEIRELMAYIRSLK